MSDEKSRKQMVAEQIFNMPTYRYDGVSVKELFTSLASSPNRVGYRNVCQSSNNVGDVEIVSDYLKSGVELLANSCDAYLCQHRDEDSGFNGFDTRDDLLNKVDDEEICLHFSGDHTGKGSSGEISFAVIDRGCGVDADNFEDAFLRDPSNGGVDKREYNYLYGELAQGSLNSIGVSKEGCKFIASSPMENPGEWMYAISNSKDDNYKYPTIGGNLPTFSGSFDLGDLGTIDHGTVTKVFNIDTSTVPQNVTGGRFIRNLGHEFPDPSVPIRIVDTRGDRNRSRVWYGMKAELENREDIKHLNKLVTLDGFGKVNIDVYIVDDEFDEEFVSSQTLSRMFFTIYGMTHHKENYSTIASDLGLNGICENVLMFVDWVDPDIDCSDVFETSRSGLSKGSCEGDKYYNLVCEEIKDWEELQRINKMNEDITDKVGRNGRSPIKTLEFSDVDDTDGVPVIESESTDFEVSLEISCNIDDYLNMDHIDFDIKGTDANFNVEGNKVSAKFNAYRDDNYILVVRDSEFGCTEFVEFEVSISESFGSEAERFAKKADKTAEDTMIPKNLFVDWDGFDEELENKSEYISALMWINWEDKSDLVDEISDLLINFDDTEGLIEFMFECLSYTNCDGKYIFKESSWDISETSEKINRGDENVSKELAKDLVEIGFDKVPLGIFLPAYYRGLQVRGSPDYRKSLQGDLYEEKVTSVVEGCVEELNNKLDINLKTAEQEVYDFENDNDNKKFDNAIMDSDDRIIVAFEANCYSNTGSKISEICRSSSNQKINCNRDGIEYIRVTDGYGLSEKNYRDAYIAVDGNLYNLDLLEENLTSHLLNSLDSEQ